MNFPSVVVKGDWIKVIDDAQFDSQKNSLTSLDWTLIYYIRGPVNLDCVAVANGVGWLTEILSTDSDKLTAGDYWADAVLVDDPNAITKRITVVRIPFKVADRLSGIDTQGFDGRSQTLKDLAAVQNAMRALASGNAVQEYTIGNRSIKKMAMTDLLEWESRLKAQAAREGKGDAIKSNLGNPHNLLVRFNK